MIEEFEVEVNTKKYLSRAGSGPMMSTGLGLNDNADEADRHKISVSSSSSDDDEQQL